MEDNTYTGREYEKKMDEWLDLMDTEGITTMSLGKEKDEALKQFKKDHPRPKWSEPKIETNE